MPHTIEKEVYKFNGLSDQAKEKAREWFRQGNCEDPFWSPVEGFMRYFVVLQNSGGCELDRREIGTKGSDEPNVSEAVAEFAQSVVIYPGDTIRVIEREGLTMISNAKWLRLNSSEEFLQFQQGRITRSPFPLGGFIYTTRATPDDGKTLYSGNSFADARAAVPRGEC